MNNRYRPHDLLEVLPHRGFFQVATPYDWGDLEENLREAPMVVVRRAQSEVDHLPVGIRGRDRHQRYAASMLRVAVRKVWSPEQLRTLEVVRPVPALQALRALQRQWSTAPYLWGPTGSVGFELASGIATVKETSDLDLLVRCPEPLTQRELGEIANDCDRLGCRVDVQIETTSGAFALSELLSKPEKLLLRTGQGPVLVRNPWQLFRPDRGLA